MELIEVLFISLVIFGMTWIFFGVKREKWQQITQYVEGCTEKRIYIFLFFSLILFQCWLPLLRKQPISADEIYTIAGGSAYFGGYNLSEYMHMKRFYNFGYAMLLSPFYRIFHDSVPIYRSMLFCNILVHTIFVLIVYYILRKIFQCSKCFSIAVTLSSTCNAVILFFRGFIYNEIPLALIVWLILLLLLKLSDVSGKKKLIFSALLGLLSAYAYIIHSRCIIIYITLILLFVMYLAAYKKVLINPISFAATFIPVLYACKYLVSYVQQDLYLKPKGAVMVNSVEQVASSTSRYQVLTSLSGIKEVLYHFFSLSGALSIQTGGLLIIVTVAVLYYLFKNILLYVKGKENKKLFILVLYATLSMWGMVAAISLTGAANQKIRFIFYSRYFMPFIGPFLMTGIYLLKKYAKFNFKYIVLWSTVLILCACAAIIFYAFPIVNKTSMSEITSFFLFIPFSRWKGAKNFSKSVIAIALVLMICFIFGLLFLYKKKQMIAFCTVTIIFSGCLFLQIEQHKCYWSSESRNKVADSLKQITDDEELIGESEVYCVGNDKYKKLSVIRCYDKEIIYDTKQNMPTEKDIIVSNKLIRMSNYNPRYVYKMDGNEWIGIWDEELKQKLEKKYTWFSRVEVPQ